MIGFVDEAVLFALKRAWRIVSADVTVWRSMFSDRLVAEQTEVDAWFSALTAPVRSNGPGLAFGLADLRNPAYDTPTGLFTRLVGGRAVIDPLGMGGAGDDEDEGYLALQQSVEVIVVSHTKRLAAALATFCASALFSSIKALTANGHISNLKLEDVTETGPMRDLLPERGGGFWYRLRLSATSEIKLVAFESELLALPISVHDVTATDEDGIQGRIVPQEVG